MHANIVHTVWPRYIRAWCWDKAGPVRVNLWGNKPYSWEQMDVDIKPTVSKTQKREREKVETQYARNKVNT